MYEKTLNRGTELEKLLDEDGKNKLLEKLQKQLILFDKKIINANTLNTAIDEILGEYQKLDANEEDSLSDDPNSMF